MPRSRRACSPRSTPSSARSPRRCAGRCGCSPVPAPARPGRSPTGSPTASPPASTRRPRCSRSPSPPGRRARCARGCAQLGARRVQARTFHSAALRQLRYFWPHVYGTELPTLTESKIGAARRAPPAGSGSTPTRRCCATSPPRSSGPRSATSTPTTTPRSRRRAAARSPASTPTTVGRVFAAYEDVKREPGPDGHGGRPAAHRRPARRRRAGGRPGPPAVQVVRRRRVPGRLAAPVGAARPVARRPRRALRGRRPGADDLLLRRRRRRLPARLPDEVPRHHLDRAGPQLPLHARRSSTAANTLLAGTPSQGVELRAQQPGRPGGAATPATPTRSPRPPRSPTGSRELRAGRHAARRDRRAVPHQRPVRGVRGGAGRRAASRTSCAAPPGSSTGPRSARRSPCCAAPPAPARPADDLARGRPRRSSPAWAGPPSRPTGRGQTRDRWESWQALVDQAEEFAARPTAPTSAASSTTSTAAPPSSTRRSPTASPSRRSTPPRAWSGTRCSCAASRTARCRSPTPTPRRAVEEERRLLYVGMTRARADLALSWALARNPGQAGRAASRRGSSTRCCPSRREPAPSQRPQPQGARDCRECGRPLVDRRPRRSVGRCADCPAPYDEELFERLREWRKERAARGRGAGVRGLHRRHPAADRRAQAAHAEQALLRISGVGRAKLERYGEDVLDARRLTADPGGPRHEEISRNTH